MPSWEQALAEANRVKAARTQLKRELKAMTGDESRHRLADLLLERNEFLSSRDIGEVLMYARGVGRDRMLRMCSSVPVGESKTTGDMTDRQLTVLSWALRRNGSS